jgi:GNAT superfamily N-acetyltransferase
MISLIEDISTETDETLDQMGGAFFREGKLPGGFDPVIFRRTWDTLIKAGVGVLFKIAVGDKMVGGLGGTIYGDPNDGQLVAQEMFWFVDADHRGGMAPIRLLKNFEDWARSRGASRVHMAHLLELQPDKIRDFYERRGYKAVEVVYSKDL